MMIEGEASYPRPYYVMFVSIDGAVPSETAVRLLNRCGGVLFRAFNGDFNARHSAGSLCFARDARHADLVIYLHNACTSMHQTTLSKDPRCLHWHITGLSQSSNSAERERSARRAETELDIRIKLMVIVYERERMWNRTASLPSRVGTSEALISRGR